MKRVLVTGGAGFLGSHLCERLIADGCRVLCMDSFEAGAAENLAPLIDHSRFDFVQHDVADPMRVGLQLDEIFHLACPASPRQYLRDPVRAIRTAVYGTMNLLEVARRSRARLLVTSTSAVYGDPLEHPQSESYWGNVNPVGERACHDEAKRCAEALVTSHAIQYGTDCRIARVFNTYGPRMREDDDRVVSSFVVQALRDEPLTIHGDGRQTRSFCYVSDLIEGLVRLMGCPTDPGPVNLGDPAEVEVRGLAELIIQLAGSRSELVRRPPPGDDPVRTRPDITWAREVLGWRPTVELSDGLTRVIAHFRDRLALETPAARAAGGL
jgi:UDP-glucuronate decarboxylase